MTALAGQGQPAALVTIEHGTQGDQLQHPCRTLVHEDPTRRLIAEVDAGGQRVSQVQVGGVGIATQHRCHAALGPAGGGLLEVALREDTDHQAPVSGTHGG